jgi:RNA polymerase sigma factor (sigma-70 family)
MLEQIRRIAGVPRATELSDAQLLERFVTGQDEGAFTALVRRHGPMVQGVCRRVLQNLHDAEDAFQATFLILARKAASISKPAALVGWLHEVARRTAERARASAATRRLHERQAPEVPQIDFIAAVAWRDLQPVLDEEVGRLPERYRVPFVLCYLEGHTYEQAAAQLNCLPGTISRRLAQARELLRTRLTRRGLTLPAGVLAAALAQHAAPAAVPARLVASLLKAAPPGATGAGALSAPVAALVEGGVRAATLTKTRLVLVLVLAVGVLGLGVRAGADRADEGGRKEEKQQPTAPPSAALLPAAAFALPPSVLEKTTVTGRVLDAAGKPVPGAHVAVLGRRKAGHRAESSAVYPEALAQGRAGDDGRFRLTVPRTARARFHETFAQALAPGHGLAVQEFDADAARPDVTVRLAREQVLRGRLVDLQGVPAAGVRVRVSKFGGPPFQARRSLVWYGQAPAGLSVWPAAATDADGRFTLRGVPAEASVTLQMDGDRFAVQALVINPDALERQLLDQSRRLGPQARVTPSLQLRPAAPGQPLDVHWSLKPARILEGAVTYADMGKPVPHARVVCFVGHETFYLTYDSRKEHRTGADGRFRIVAEPGNYFILVAYPAEGTPYLLRTAHLKWPAPTAARQTVDLKLPRGVLVRGRVTEQPAGAPVAGASVEFVPRRVDNRFYQEGVTGPLGDLKQLAVSDADGTFALPVLPGPGHLLVNGPTPDYLHAQTTERKLSRGEDGGRRYYPNALVKLDLKPQAGPHEVAVTLRRGVTVKGRLLGPDGKPVASAQIFYRDYIPRGYTTEPMRTLEARAGAFELPGLDPDRPQPVFFIDVKNQLGAVVELPAKAGKEPLTVRLQRCGTAVLRPVDGDGKPIAGFRPYVEVLVTPGANGFDAMLSGKVAADYAWMVNLDRARHKDIRPDKDGRVTVPTLIPGATLRLLGQVPGRGILDMNRTFVVEAGQSLDLKDVPVPMP